MINGISNALKLAEQLTPISYPIKVKSTNKIFHQKKHEKSNIGKYRFDAFNRWGIMCEIQHSVSSEQIVQQTLLRYKELLQSMLKRINEKKLNNAFFEYKNELIETKPKYLGIPLFDNKLNRANGKDYLINFKFQNFNLLSICEQNEQLLIHIPFNGSIASIDVFFGAFSNEFQQQKLLNLKLNQYGIQCNFDPSKKMSSDGYYFSCPISMWENIKDNIMLQGQGFRLPAGSRFNVKTDEILNWQDPKEWNFDNDADCYLSKVKITKSLHKIESQLKDSEDERKTLLDLLRLQEPLHSNKKIDTLPKSFLYQDGAMKQEAVLAQANIVREQTEQLLMIKK